MSEEIRAWGVGANDRLTELERTPLDLEERLQRWLADDISILDSELLVIGREVETDFGGYIDLLCMDREANLVVVELKRDKTPRNVTAQALEYGSWVADLGNERVTAIANRYLQGSDLPAAFQARFGVDLPETINTDHRILIVGSQIDDRSERIIKYLSDTHGVNINAATFQHFRDADGAEFLARVFLMEPEAVELQSRTRGASKRRPNLTYEELEALAHEAGVDDWYEHAVRSFDEVLRRQATRSSIAFYGQFGESNLAVISFLPGESNGNEGLRYQVYKRRFARLADKPLEEIETIMPESREYWIYTPSSGPDYEGYQGFIRSREEIDRLVDALRDSGEDE